MSRYSLPSIALYHDSYPILTPQNFHRFALKICSHCPLPSPPRFRPSSPDRSRDQVPLRSRSRDSLSRPGQERHGAIGNPLQRGVSIGKTLINHVFSIGRFDYRRVKTKEIGSEVIIHWISLDP